jgi:hypothetical protein
MFKRFLPKETNFFPILNEISANVLNSARIMNEMFTNNGNYSEYSASIHILENKCDDLTHQVISDLNDTFITPIDREDIYALVNSLDDIIDTIDTIGSRLSMYKLRTPLQFGVQLSDILLIQVGVLNEVINSLQDPKLTTEKIVQVKSLETQGDVVFKDALVNLFENEKDVFDLIKKKEILEITERAIDKCHHSATVVEGILIKNM